MRLVTYMLGLREFLQTQLIKTFYINAVHFYKKVSKRKIRIKHFGTCLEVQWLRLHLTRQGARVRSLFSELRSHMPQSQKTKNMQQKQCCNKFNKTL